MTEVEIFKQSLDVSRIAMFITFFMTIVTVTFSALGLAFQRSHNIKSIKPICSFTFIFSNNNFKVLLKNAGLGPLIVSGITIIDENEIESEISKGFENILSNYEIKSINTRMKSGCVIPINDEKIVLEIILDDKNMKVNELIDLLNKYCLILKYNDLYDRKYKLMENCYFDY
jgi:hypothetical protein